MTTLVAQVSLNKIDPTGGFISYVQDVKPYHTKILETSIEYVYQEDIAVTVVEGQNLTVSLTRPDPQVYTTCGFGTVWDSLLVADYPVATIRQAIGNVLITTVPLVDPLQPTVLTIANDPLNYSLQVNDPITFQTTGSLPTTTLGSISPGLVYYVLSNTGTQITISTSLGGIPLAFTSVGTGTLSIHPEHLLYNSFLVEQPTPVQFQCIASNIQANQFTFVKAYSVTNVNSATKEWTVLGQLIFPAHQDISFSNIRLGTDATGLLNNNTNYYMTINIDGVSTLVSGPGNALQTVADIVTAINTAIGTLGAAVLMTVGTNSVIRITSATLGYDSTVSILDGPGRAMMKAVTYFNGFAPSVNDTVVIPSNYIYVRNNTGAGANTQYTIVSGTFTGTHTAITVLEAISAQAANNGIINIQDDITVVPSWVTGTAVQVSATTLPHPLAASTKYYFVPTDASSIFNLSYKPQPTEFADIIDITDFGSGMINISRTELFYPGAVVAVSGTFDSINNGVYHINQVIPEDPYLRVYTQQKVSRYTPPGITTDGTMRLDDHAGYDYPTYCAIIQAPDLYTRAFVDERLSFEFVLTLTDRVSTTAYEDNAGSPGITETLTYTSVSPFGYGISPVGFDTQFYDIGVLDEDNYFINHNLPKIL